MTGVDYSQLVPAAERSLRLLECLAATTEGLTTAELLDELEGSRSGLYALLNTLKTRDYVVSEDGRHRLGPAVWGLVPDRPRDLETLVEGFSEVRSDFDETLALVWPHHSTTAVVAESQADRPVRVVYPSGSRRPDDSPGSLVIAAGGPGEDDRLNEVRSRGGATSTDGDLTEIAVPVCRDGVRPTAALIVGIPAHRADPATVAQIDRSLRQTAARLSHRLGASVYQPYGWAATEPVGPSQDLSEAELDEFLWGLWGAQLACVRSDGTPHVVPLWYEWDGEAMWLAASPGSSWRAHVAENPRVSITLDEPWPPLRRVFMSGRATEMNATDVPGGLAGLRRRLASRYLGKGAADQAELKDTEGWAAIRITPDRIHGRQGLGPMALAGGGK